MEYYVTQFASTETAPEGGIFGALGIDVTMLALQAIAFLILVWLLGKFVYPVFIKAVDDRQAKIEESTKAADTAKEMAEDAQKEVAKLLATARKEAKDIVTTAKDEATASLEASDSKALARAKKIVESAQDEIEKDVIAAKKALHNETLDLVASATEKILQQKVDSKADQSLMAAAVKEVR